MFDRVLIAEDHPSASLSVKFILNELKIAHDPRYYCDDALKAVKIAVSAGTPYDLLITDLSFDDDGNRQEIADGKALIAAARQVQPDLKVLVFSIESKAYPIKKLYSQYNIDGYVMKGRSDVDDLREAIDAIGKGRRYVPAKVRQLLRQSERYEFSGFDETIIKLLCEGKSQKELSDHLRKTGASGSSLSSIEKRLHHIKQALEFSNNEQLIAYCKDIGIV